MLYNDRIADIEQLLIKKHLDQLDPTEATRLEVLLKEHSEAIALSEYYIKIGRYDLPHKDEIPSQREAYERMVHKANQLPVRIISRKRFWSYTLAAAAAILCVVLISVRYNDRSTLNSNRGLSAMGKDTASQITLQLANGDQVVLNQAGKQTIQVGESELVADNTEKTLEIVEVSNKDSRWNTLDVPRKLDYKINLSDGSTVHLNASTRLKFPFSFTGKKREVYIEGEAYFTVVKKANQPFIVHTAEADIEVLGTEFNINTYSNEVIQAALVNGSIKVKGDKQQVLMKPGDHLMAHNEDYLITPLDEDAVLSWRRGVYYFYNTPLQDINAMLVRWFDVEVVIDDAAMKFTSFSGKLDKKQPLINFLRAMQATSMFNYRFEGRVLHISR
jgi:ferric-dicitrate binding protein FerR (iron transport regulator)